VLLSVSVLAGRAGAGGGGVPTQHPRGRTYVVRPGDTLWAIAVRLVGPGEDPRPVVDGLGKANHVESGVIHVGELLVLPAS
jgi:Tfp pilus assembly protein FimV